MLWVQLTFALEDPPYFQKNLQGVIINCSDELKRFVTQHGMWLLQISDSNDEVAEKLHVFILWNFTMLTIAINHI